MILLGSQSCSKTTLAATPEFVKRVVAFFELVIGYVSNRYFPITFSTFYTYYSNWAPPKPEVFVDVTCGYAM